MRKFLSVVFSIMAVFVTIWQFGKIAWIQINPILEKSESNLKSIIIISITVIVIGFLAYLLYKYVILPPYLGLGLDISDKNQVKVEQNRKYTLSANDPKCHLESKIIFLEEPKQDELVDIIDVYGQKIPSGFEYSSPDSVEINRVQKKSSVYIYWKPKDRIDPYIPYTHVKEYFMPDDYDSYEDGGYSFEVISDVPNGEITIEVESHHPVEKAVVFKVPRIEFFDDILKYADQINRTVGPLPTINGHHVKWQGNNFDVDRRYSLVIFYEGYKEKLYNIEN